MTQAQKILLATIFGTCGINAKSPIAKDVYQYCQKNSGLLTGDTKGDQITLTNLVNHALAMIAKA
jgi:hypothetical protein